MATSPIIISESNRPIWQIPVAALFFTLAFGPVVYELLLGFTNNTPIHIHINDFQSIVYFTALGIGFTYKKRVYIDLKHSKFKPSYEVGPLKFGKWMTIKTYEYISVFLQPLTDGTYIYEVNLWYDTNKHFQLYEKHDYKEAFLIGYQISEELNIDLLDATVPHDYKWIDKKVEATQLSKPQPSKN